MDFELTGSQAELVEATRRLAVERIAPGARQRELAHAIPPELIRELGERKLMGVNIPASLGGAEAGAVAYVHAVREVAAADASVAVTMAVSSMVAEVIYQFGTPEQRERHVPKIVRGEYFGGAFALSEPGAGSDAASLTTRAEWRKDRWILNGRKMWITTGDQAGVNVVWARTGGPGPKGISCFLVEKDTPGLTAEKPEEKMGLRASHTVSLTLEDVELPAGSLLGQQGGGFAVAMVALDGGRIGIGAQASGVGRAALDACVQHVAGQGGGRGGKPDAHQGAQLKLADMATEVDTGWLLTVRAAWLKECGQSFSHAAAMAKVRASEGANRVVRDAVEIFGVQTCDNESAVARMFRDCRVAQIYEGTSEIQRLVISRHLLREGE